jgi:type I restriction-modification system DNA methylase subunit
MLQPFDISTLESHLWEAANILRGSPVDRTDWKSYILPLMFFKHICDVWDEEYEEAVKTYGEDFDDEHLKEQHEAGQLHSIAFLKALLDLARDLVNAEKEVPPAEDEDRGKTALTELFQQTRTTDTPIMVERIVDDIDDIVRQIRFPDWQSTEGGKREVRKALRRTLAKYKLHTDTELFEKAYGYVREYY